MVIHTSMFLQLFPNCSPKIFTTLFYDFFFFLLFYLFKLRFAFQALSMRIEGKNTLKSFLQKFCHGIQTPFRIIFLILIDLYEIYLRLYSGLYFLFYRCVCVLLILTRSWLFPGCSHVTVLLGFCRHYWEQLYCPEPVLPRGLQDSSHSHLCWSSRKNVWPRGAFSIAPVKEMVHRLTSSSPVSGQLSKFHLSCSWFIMFFKELNTLTVYSARAFGASCGPSRGEREEMETWCSSAVPSRADVQLCPTQQPHILQLTRLLCLWNFPGKNPGVSGHFPLQGIFPTQGSNLRLLSWQADSSLLSCLGNPCLGYHFDIFSCSWRNERKTLLLEAFRIFFFFLSKLVQLQCGNTLRE